MKGLLHILIAIVLAGSVLSPSLTELWSNYQSLEIEWCTEHSSEAETEWEDTCEKKELEDATTMSNSDCSMGDSLMLSKYGHHQMISDNSELEIICPPPEIL